MSSNGSAQPLPAASQGYHADATANALRARIAAMQPPAAALASWDGALLSNALWRLKQVIDVWQDCRSLRIIITREEGSWRPHFRHWRLGGTERFFDRGIMLFSTGSAAAAVMLACSIWISSGWNDGAGAVTLAAVAVLLLRRARRTRAAWCSRFFVATGISVVAAGIYLFAVLPHVHDFPMLVILFAAPFILVGTLIPRPQFNMATVLVAVNTATFISIQDAYDAELPDLHEQQSRGPRRSAVRVSVDPRDAPVRRRTRGVASAALELGRRGAAPRRRCRSKIRAIWPRACSTV